MSILQKKAKQAFKIWRHKGLYGLKQSLNRNYLNLREKLNYQKWIREFDTLTNEDRERILQKIESLSHKPLISVVLPVYNVEEKWLRLCIESVSKQLYENWELCIADDASPNPHVKQILEEYAANDQRIKVVFRRENGHISAASNSALSLVTGEFTALLDHDDELAEHAFYFVAKEINDYSAVDMIYSDEDLMDEKGRRFAPKFKPDWSPDFFYSLNLITHLSVYRTEVLRKISGFRIGLEGSQDYDLALRVIEQILPENIRHIPHILYHWRAIRGSVALSGDEKPYAHERARQAIRDHFERTGKNVEVSKNSYNLHRVTYKLPKALPKSSLIIPEGNNFENTHKVIKAFLENTRYENFEVILICSENTKTKLENTPLSNKVKFFVVENANEACKRNYAVQASEGDILIFAEADLYPLSENWVNELAGFAWQKEIGVVGGKILNADKTIRSSGIILGIKGVLGFAHRGLERDAAGTFGRAYLINNYSAVSGIIAIRRETFVELGGFDESNFGNGLFEVDFCLRLQEKSLRVVYTPHAEFIQLSDSLTEKIINTKNTVEVKFFKEKWKHLIENDPFYNPNLSLENEWFGIAQSKRMKELWKEN